MRSRFAPWTAWSSLMKPVKRSPLNNGAPGSGRYDARSCADFWSFASARLKPSPL
jgi:hypothetical protein